MQETNVCEDVRIDQEIRFDVTLEHFKCTDQNQFSIELGPSGLSETLHLDVFVECGCECERDATVCARAALPSTFPNACTVDDPECGRMYVQWQHGVRCVFVRGIECGSTV
jgi:hypothetical protein